MTKELAELLVYESGGSPKSIALPVERISLGRANSNDLAYPDDSGLSRQHLIIEQEGADLVVRDLGSKNGTELNSQRLTGSRVLQPGDKVKAGHIVIEYRVGGAKPAE